MPELKWIDPGYLCIAVPGTEMFVDSGIVRRDWEKPLGLLERQVAAAPEMYALLKDIEWAKVDCRDESIDVCPSCNNLECFGHEPDCRLAVVLKAVEGEDAR